MIQKTPRRRSALSRVIETTFRLTPNGRIRILQIKPYARRFDNKYRWSLITFRDREEAQKCLFYGALVPNRAWSAWQRDLGCYPE